MNGLGTESHINHDETLDLLRRGAEALYGSQWHGDLARALGVNIRTVQRWSAGEYLPPRGIWLELIDLMKTRREELARLARETSSATSPFTGNRACHLRRAREASAAE